MHNRDDVELFLGERVGLRSNPKAWLKALNTCEQALLSFATCKQEWEESLADWFAIGFFNRVEHDSAVERLNGVAEDVPQVGMHFMSIVD
jgi:hypothetical protein